MEAPAGGDDAGQEGVFDSSISGPVRDSKRQLSSWMFCCRGRDSTFSCLPHSLTSLQNADTLPGIQGMVFTPLDLTFRWSCNPKA